jgi:hypothetical protein
MSLLRLGLVVVLLWIGGQQPAHELLVSLSGAGVSPLYEQGR